MRRAEAWGLHFLGLEWFGVGCQGFAEGGQITFVDDGGAGVHPGRHRRGWGGAPVFEFVDGVVMQVVQESHAIEGHYVGLLRYGRVYAAAIDPRKGFRIFVEGNDGNLAGHVHAMQGVGGACSAGGLEADHTVDLLLFGE